MSVLGLIAALLFLGGVLWLVNMKIPNLNPTIRWIINTVVIIIAIVIALVAFGIWDEIRGMRVPKI